MSAPMPCTISTSCGDRPEAWAMTPARMAPVRASVSRRGNVARDVMRGLVPQDEGQFVGAVRHGDQRQGEDDVGASLRSSVWKALGGWPGRSSTAMMMSQLTGRRGDGRAPRPRLDAGGDGHEGGGLVARDVPHGGGLGRGLGRGRCLRPESLRRQGCRDAPRQGEGGQEKGRKEKGGKSDHGARPPFLGACRWRKASRPAGDEKPPSRKRQGAFRLPGQGDRG